VTTPLLVGEPLDERRTHVTIRRIVQYLLDLVVLSGALAGVGWVLGRLVPAWGFAVTRSGSLGIGLVGAEGPGTPAIGMFALVVLGFVAFVLLPFWTGRTLLMMALGLRIVRRDGAPASFGQHVGRTLLLVVDTIAGGLVGLIVMLCSRRRQRVGDHAAGTVVVRDRRE
jgi:uncharacterized RDD family membrane protein YckC